MIRPEFELIAVEDIITASAETTTEKWEPTLPWDF